MYIYTQRSQTGGLSTNTSQLIFHVNLDDCMLMQSNADAGKEEKKKEQTERIYDLTMKTSIQYTLERLELASNSEIELGDRHHRDSKSRAYTATRLLTLES